MRLVRPELILYLKDAFTEKAPHLPYELSFSPQAGRWVRNSRNYLLLYRSLAPQISISLKSPYYRDLNLSLSLPAEGLQVGELWPKEIYPFPRGTTLLWGRVTKGGLPLVGALVKIKTLFEEIETVTDEKGSFLLFPRQVEGERLLRRNGKLFLPGPRGGRRLPLKIKGSGLSLVKRIHWPVGEKTRLVIEGGL